MLSKWKTNLVNHVFATNHLINSLLGEIILNYILIPLWSENNLSQKHLSKDKRFTLSLYFRWIRAQVAVSQASTSGPHQEHSLSLTPHSDNCWLFTGYTKPGTTDPVVLNTLQKISVLCAVNQQVNFWFWTERHTAGFRIPWEWNRNSRGARGDEQSGGWLPSDWTWAALPPVCNRASD